MEWLFCPISVRFKEKTCMEIQKLIYVREDYRKKKKKNREKGTCLIWTDFAKKEVF